MKCLTLLENVNDEAINASSHRFIASVALLYQGRTFILNCKNYLHSRAMNDPVLVTLPTKYKKYRNIKQYLFLAGLKGTVADCTSRSEVTEDGINRSGSFK
jgi:hypothetical protein